MANSITNALVTTTESVNIGKLHYIKIVQVITDGVGDFIEVLNGGDARINLTLQSGHQKQKLKVGETVTITGHSADGNAISFPSTFKVTQAHHPWEFAHT